MFYYRNMGMDLGAWEKTESCIGCKYYRSLYGKGQYICHYNWDTDQLRGCPVENCEKKDIGQHEANYSKFLR